MEHKKLEPNLRGAIPDMTPGDIILLKRTELRMSQEELEWASGISARQIGNIEKNRHRPTFETIERLERALEIPLMEDFIAYWRSAGGERSGMPAGSDTAKDELRRLEKELARRKLSVKEVHRAVNKLLEDLDSKSV